jgi:hypothetical protein
MHLKIVSAESEPPQVGFAATIARRPGERREPISLVVPPSFARAAREIGLPLALAVELALERAVAEAELRAVGCAELWPEIVAVARLATVTAAAPTHARYLRALTLGRHQTEETDADECVLEAPLRLFPRVLDVYAETALTGDRLGEALALEVAAVGSGRLIIEWVLLQALASLADATER